VGRHFTALGGSVAKRVVNGDAPDTSLAVVLYLAALSALGEFATTSYLPAISSIASGLGVRVTVVQATVTLGLVVSAASGLLVGAFVDALPRKSVLLVGLASYTIGSLLAAVAPGYMLLFAGRALQASGSCVGLMIGRAIARDLSKGAELTKLLAGVNLIYLLAPAVAPIIGGFLDEWLGWRAIFGFAALYGATVFVGAFALRESRRPIDTGAQPEAMLRRYVEILGSPRFLLSSFQSAALLGALFAFVVNAAPMFVSELGFRPAVVGFFPGITVAGVVLGSYLAGQLATTWRPETLVGVGAAIAFAAAIAMTASPVAAPSLLSILIVFNIGLGIVMPASTAIALSGFAHCAGAASALVGFVQVSGGAVGSILVSVIDLPPHTAMPIAMLVLSGASLTSTLLLRLFPAH